MHKGELLGQPVCQTNDQRLLASAVRSVIATSVSPVNKNPGLHVAMTRLIW